eukprot:1013159-Prymnesium_polylepis.1
MHQAGDSTEERLGLSTLSDLMRTVFEPKHVLWAEHRQPRQQRVRHGAATGRHAGGWGAASSSTRVERFE